MIFPSFSHDCPIIFPSFSHECPIIFPWLSYSTWPFLGLHLPVLDIPPLPAIPAAQAPSQVRHLHQGLHYSCRGHVQIGIQQCYKKKGIISYSKVMVCT
jgi:hypothetical protein